MERRIAAKLSVAAKSVGVAGTILPMLHVRASAQLSNPQLDAEMRTILRMLLQIAGPAQNNGPQSDEPPGRHSDAVVIAAAACDLSCDFIALLCDGDQYLTVHGHEGCVTESLSGTVSALRALLTAASDGRIEDFRPASSESEAALRALHRWAAHRDARLAAGLHAAAGARARRHLLSRIHSISRRAAPHDRPRVHEMAARARLIATASFGRGAERILEDLAGAAMPDEAWLRAIHTFGDVQLRAAATTPSTELRVAALLILRRS
jgi:hypothetical protein